MSDYFLTLPIKEQSEILNGLATKPEISRNAVILEKDIWVCWALETLFNMPNRLPMAFKGGTSLSKVFDVINRFSEDIDLTINYEAFCNDDIFSGNISRAKLKNIRQRP